MFPIPRDNFRSLVANLIIEKLLKLCKLILVRVFHEGYLTVIGRKRVSRDQNDINIAMVTGNVFPLGDFLFEALERNGGYGNVKVCQLRLV